MPLEPLRDAVYLKVEAAIEDNYRGADGSYPVSPSAVASLATSAALAAIEEQGMVIVSAEDLRAVVGETRSYETYTAALPRLRAVLSGTAPQPSDAPRGAQTVDPEISRCPDLPGASTALSGARAEEAEERIDALEQAVARVIRVAREMAAYSSPSGAAGPYADEIACAVLNLDPRDTPPGVALAALEAGGANLTDKEQPHA